MNRLVLWVMMLALMCSFVFGSSGDPTRVEVTNCMLSPSTVACGDEVNATCGVSALYAGTSVVTSVNYQIGGKPFEATRTSGNTTNGTWSVLFSIDSLWAGVPITFDQVLVRTSGTIYCQNDEWGVGKELPSCHIAFGANISVVNTCVCEYVTSTSSVQIDNSITYTSTPSVGCSPGTLATTYSDFADYCNPDWVAEYSACTGTFNDSLNPFVGKTIKTYYPGNPGCCGETSTAAGEIWFNHNTGSDCKPPLDQGNSLTCYMDFWEKYQKDIGSQGVNPSVSGFNVDDYTQLFATYEASYQPLVYDVTKDGVVDVVAASRNLNSVRVFRGNDLVVESTVSLAPAYPSAQPAFWGIDYFGGESGVSVENAEKFNETVFLQPYVLMNHVPLMVVPIKNGSNSYIHVYGFTTGSPVLLHSTNFGAVGLSGVACYSEYCYFQSSDGYGWRFNPQTYDIMSVNLAVYWDGDSWEGLGGITPVLNATPSFGPDVVGSDFYRKMIVFPQYGYNFGVYPYSDIQVMVTDESLTRLSREIFSPRTASLSGSEPQRNISIRGNVVIYGVKMYVATEETFKWGGNASNITGMQLSMSQLTLDPYPLSNPGVVWQATPKMLWLGKLTASSEGMSNPVIIDGYPSVQLNVLTSSASGGSGTTFLPPAVIDGMPANLVGYNFGNMHVTDDGELLIAYGPGYAVPFYVFRISTGALIYSNSNSQSYWIGGQSYFADSLDKFYIAQQWSCCDGYWRSYVQCFDFSVPSSIASCPYWGIGISGGQQSSVIGLVDGKIVADEAYNKNPGTSVFDSYNSSIRHILGIDIEHTGGHPLFYDRDADIMYLSGKMVTKWSEVMDGDNVGALVSYPSLPAAMNMQPGSIRYIDAGGYKYKILSVSPLSYQKTSLRCGNGYFAPIFYNSDKQILGINRQRFNDTNGPTFAWCDFSDELNPIITDTGIYILHNGLASNISGVYTWSAPLLQIEARDDNLEDETSWKLSMIGYVGMNPQKILWVYDIDERRDPPSAQAASYSAVVVLDENLNTRRSVTSNFTSRQYATVSDFTGDGRMDLITSRGGFSPEDSLVKSKVFAAVQDSWNIPVDLNADFVLDLLTISPGTSIMYAYLTSPEVRSVDYGVPNVTLRCSVIENSGNVYVQVVARLPDPTKLSVGINPGDNTGWFFPDIAYDGTYTVQYSQSGSYTISVQVSQTNNVSAKATSNCSVTMNMTQSQLVSDVCSIGNDGEFDYIDPVTLHNWLGDNVIPVSGWAPLDDQKISHLVYGVDSPCRYTTMTMTVRLDPFGEFTEVQFLGKKSTAFGIRVDARTDQVLSNSGEVIMGYTSGPVVATIVLDRTTGKGKVIIGGVVVYAADTDLTGADDIDSIVLNGYGKVDYVRFGVSGNMQITPYSPDIPDLAGDSSYLIGCDAEQMAESTDRDVRNSYDNLLMYCGSTPLKVCEYPELQKIVSRFPECTKEVYNYCVRVAYPLSQKIPVGTVELNGGTACSAMIGVSVGWTGVVTPVAGILWTTLTSGSTLYLTLFILLVVVVLLPIINKRR